MREVDPIPSLELRPTAATESIRATLASGFEACAAVPPRVAPSREALAQLLRPLVESQLAHLGPAPLPGGLGFTFASLPGLELQFEPRAKDCAAFLRCAAGDESHEHGYSRYGELADLVRSAAGKVEGDGPIFLLQHGVPVATDAVMAVLRQSRWKVERVAAAPQATAELITKTAEFLTSGIWDMRGRDALVALVTHTNSPAELARRLSGHVNPAIREACATRLARGG